MQQKLVILFKFFQPCISFPKSLHQFTGLHSYLTDDLYPRHSEMLHIFSFHWCSAVNEINEWQTVDCPYHRIYL